MVTKSLHANLPPRKKRKLAAGGQQETDNGTADIKAQREAELAQDKVASSESEDYDSEASLSEGAVRDGHKPEAIVPVGRKQDDIERESDEDNVSDADVMDGDDEGLESGSEHSESEAEKPKSKKKDKSMASAFAEILAHPGSSQKGIDAPILLGSKSLAKKKRQAEEASASQNQAKHLRQEIRRRCHKKVPKKGADPEQDATEKMLQRIATRGVVQLFNAVSKAQQARKQALTAGAKTKEANISKSEFFSELKKGLANSQDKAKEGQRKDGDEEPASKRGWDVLQPGFAGLSGKTGLKMKDWDKALPADLGLEIAPPMDSDFEDDESE